MGFHRTRREFLRDAAESAAVLALEAEKMWGAENVAGGLRGRFLTHMSVVRVNQIEVTRTRNLGEDESALNSPAHIRSRREAFARGWWNFPSASAVEMGDTRTGTHDGKQKAHPEGCAFA